MSIDGRADGGLSSYNAAGRNHAHGDPLPGRKETEGAAQDEKKGVASRRLARPKQQAPGRAGEDNLNLRRQDSVDWMVLQPRPGARRGTLASDTGMKPGHVLIQ
ncbi:hypothetical protein [Brevundimonas diminuta]|uniref:hypothetical protein n=1 Tax=Brevundimonas diminuta TaxID=293 RepID=UPI0035D7ADA3